jgi:hypothetical protein
MQGLPKKIEIDVLIIETMNGLIKCSICDDVPNPFLERVVGWAMGGTMNPNQVPYIHPYLYIEPCPGISNDQMHFSTRVKCTCKVFVRRNESLLPMLRLQLFGWPIPYAPER